MKTSSKQYTGYDFMPLIYTPEEIAETIKMIGFQNLDVRTVTLGINLRDCCDSDLDRMKERIFTKITRKAEKLLPIANQIQSKYGIPIVNKRIAVTPVSLILGSALTMDFEESKDRAMEVAICLDRAAKKVNVDFIGGYSSIVYKDMTYADSVLLDSVPRARVLLRRETPPSANLLINRVQSFGFVGKYQCSLKDCSIKSLISKGQVIGIGDSECHSVTYAF